MTSRQFSTRSNTEHVSCSSQTVEKQRGNALLLLLLMAISQRSIVSVIIGGEFFRFPCSHTNKIYVYLFQVFVGAFAVPFHSVCHALGNLDCNISMPVLVYWMCMYFLLCFYMTVVTEPIIAC